MFPDRNNPPVQHQQGALPQPQSLVPQAQLPQPQPAAAFAAGAAQPAAAPLHDLPQAVEKAKLLTQQYGTNPYAFSMAFQQVKTQYLLEQFHIDPNMEKN